MVGNHRHIPVAMKQQWATMSAKMSSKAIVQVANRALRLSSHCQNTAMYNNCYFTSTVVQLVLDIGIDTH
ncbi:hypothetical protein BDR06DRAFT_948386 [Suillus hirtellus]|nr:hypothetical protein BDR06DRAFT_948386 [Suillus hirtellus]